MQSPRITKCDQIASPPKSASHVSTWLPLTKPIPMLASTIGIIASISIIGKPKGPPAYLFTRIYKFSHRLVDCLPVSGHQMPSSFKWNNSKICLKKVFNISLCPPYSIRKVKNGCTVFTVQPFSSFTNKVVDILPLHLLDIFRGIKMQRIQQGIGILKLDKHANQGQVHTPRQFPLLVFDCHNCLSAHIQLRAQLSLR